MLDYSATPIDETWYRWADGLPERTGAGGAVSRLDGGRVLVALVKEVELGDGHYVLPKGGVEPGEDIERAALREIAEESGLTDLRRLGHLGALERRNFKRTYWQASHYGLYVTRQTGGVITDPGNYGLAWFALDALPPMFWPDEKHLLRSRAEWITVAVLASAEG